MGAVMRTSKRENIKAPKGIGAAKLAQMIEEATVDAHNESERAMGWLAMFEEHLELPFETVVLGVPVRVTRIEDRDDGRLVAICRRGTSKRSGSPICRCGHRCPRGEWIEAYRRWVGGR